MKEGEEPLTEQWDSNPVTYLTGGKRLWKLREHFDKAVMNRKPELGGLEFEDPL